MRISVLPFFESVIKYLVSAILVGLILGLCWRITLAEAPSGPEENLAEKTHFSSGSTEPLFGTENGDFAPGRVENGQNDKGYVLALLDSYSALYGVSPYTMRRVIECESQFRNVQSQITKNGVREESYGIVQIHLPSHPNVTKEQALDLEFSVEFLAKELKAGNLWKWYGYNPQADACNVVY